ncbi:MULTISPECIES: glycoside hydrolase family 13 protein [unclassified Microbacterium]|uniref:glycoside hydrolase family 13 protein n=1 Tax=unclassified Microbacterium TaxID=2609290 RepID=UPI00214C7999|nr:MULTISPECIES: glycoside hydrolase family 13 protein [unclassified Microbacterium]MCR2784188.1 glycoside hydrolase family 13 protein [Microbacterium sp. zg.B96]WIM14980.1 glycoside hydrolase family 13 protein [Microbacterium sp. zg-B96]
MTASERDWWRHAVVYQVYPRSFADSDGDGIGDLRGILSRVDYLAGLGIDAVWLSPFYPSPLADGGYDVADYRNVDPRLGTLEDMDELIAALHERGIRVVVDIVPNHTSDRHPWFQEALAAGRGSDARERYIFRDGAGPQGAEPPTDWVSMFGGPAWAPAGDGQWYLHTFAVEQPDLNWDRADVRADFVRTLRFWADRGVDGFRIDVAHMLTKDLTEPLPSRDELALIPVDGQHPLFDRDDVHDIYAEWRHVFDEYDPPRTAVAEAWVDSSRVPLYARPESLGQAFNFDLLEADFDAAQFRRVVTENLALAAASGSSSTWVLSNHDVVRPATRYGLPHPPRKADGHPAIKHGVQWLRDGGSAGAVDRVAGLQRARAAALFMLGLPGSAYLYQGEELGLPEVGDLAAADRQDPTFSRSGGQDPGRDGCRVPLPWSPEGPSFGFGAGRAHLPQPAWFAEYSVAAQEESVGSTLRLFRRALALRRRFAETAVFEWVDTGDPDVLRYRRGGGWEVVTNFGTDPYDLDRIEMAVTSGLNILGVVPPDTTVWLAPASGD